MARSQWISSWRSLELSYWSSSQPLKIYDYEGTLLGNNWLRGGLPVHSKFGWVYCRGMEDGLTFGFLWVEVLRIQRTSGKTRFWMIFYGVAIIAISYQYQTLTRMVTKWVYMHLLRKQLELTESETDHVFRPILGLAKLLTCYLMSLLK